MKQLIYVVGLVLAAGLWSCQKDVMEGEVAEGLTLNVMSGVEGLSNEALAGEVEGLHVLVYDEAGGFVTREEFAGLAETKPLKLELGRYTLAYVSNLGNEAIAAVGTEFPLDSVILSAENVDGKWRVGNVFTGTDEVTVGEDRSSDAVLLRAVGRLNVRVDGLTGGANVASVVLTGSPSSVRFTGEPMDQVVEMEAEGAMTGTGTYEGTVLAFPTSEEMATLRVAVNGTEGLETYEVALKNRLEANKVNTVNVRYNAAVVPHELTLTMEYQEEWGAMMIDSVTAQEQVTLDTLTLKLVMEEGALTDLSQVTDYYMMFENLFDSYNDLIVYNDNPCEMRGDTLVIYCNYQVITGSYRAVDVSLSSNEGTIYRLKEEMEVEIDESGVAVIVLPKGVTAAAGDLAAMKELRDVLAATDYYYARQWVAAGDDVAMWYEVELNEEGRVVSIGGSMLDSYYDGPVTRNARAASSAASRSLTTDAGYEAITLPESFKNLTELRYFTLLGSGGSVALTEVPTWLKDMENLEELVLVTETTTLPELPSGLRFLRVEGCDLTTIPASVGNLTELVVAAFNEEFYDLDEGVKNSSRIQNVEVDFSRLTKLKELIIVGADDAEAPTSLWQNGSVEELSVSGFDRIQVPGTHGMTALKEFRVKNDRMTAADLEAIASCPLLILDVEGQAFGAGESMDWVGEIGTLEEIYLRACGCTSIPESWDALTNLEYLSMEDMAGLTGQLPAGLLERYEDGSLTVSCYETPNFSPDGVIFEVAYVDLGNLSYKAGTYTVEVTSNRAWTAEVDDSTFPGLTVSPMSGSGDGTVTITVPENPDGWGKSGEVRIRVNDRNETSIYVYQNYNPNIW